MNYKKLLLILLSSVIGITVLIVLNRTNNSYIETFSEDDQTDEENEEEEESDVAADEEENTDVDALLDTYDVNEDSIINISDFTSFVTSYNTKDLAIDFNQDSKIGIEDFNLFAIAYKEYNESKGNQQNNDENEEATPTPEMSPTATPETSPIPSPTGNDSAEMPSGLLRNYKQWKITLPDGEEIKNLQNVTNEYFYVNSDKSGIVFKTPIRSTNGTTSNSDNIRSELRERTADGTADIYWTTTGKHTLYVKQSINHLPLVKPELVASQIHGNKADGIDDSMVLRLEGTKLFLSFNGGELRSDVPAVTAAGANGQYTLGKVHEVIFEVIDDKHMAYYSEDGNLLSAYNSGDADNYAIKDNGNAVLMTKKYGDAYFKAGNYTQSNKDKEGDKTGDPNNYGEVVIYDLFVNHQ